MVKHVGIGLDIGSSAVRAAEVVADGDRRVLRRFAQVGLPPGAVAEGEIREPGVVGAAIKRLWAEGGFSHKKAVVGLGSQRGMVRQIEMPTMSDGDLRSALNYKIGEFLPIPVDQATFDFATLGQDPGGTNARLLLVAAQREVVFDTMSVVRSAGIKVAAVEPSPLGLLRSMLPPGPGGGLEAVVSFGAQLVVVAVTDGGMPRFVRTVPVGSSSLNHGIAQALAVSVEAAESAKRGQGFGERAVAAAAGPGLEPIIADVRDSLQFFLTQCGASQYARVLVTGGGSMLPGFVSGLSGALGTQVLPAEVLIDLDAESLGLSGKQIADVSPRWSTAVGLALWGTGGLAAPTLVPKESSAKGASRQTMLVPVVAVGALVALLGAGTMLQRGQAQTVDNAIKAETQQANQLRVRAAGLSQITKEMSELRQQRGAAVAALGDDIDWIGVLTELSKALPSDIVVTSITLTKTPSSTTGPAASTGTGAALGTISIDASTTGGAAAVSSFIAAVSQVKDISAFWVSGVTNSTSTPSGSSKTVTTQPAGPTVTKITGSGFVTTAALSDRASKIPGGKS
jgi:type IV pilus assembly protein PilM